MKRLFALALAFAACGDDGADKTVYYSLAESKTDFFNYPFPSDERLVDNVPDMTAFPNPRNVPILSQLISIIPARTYWPAMSTSYFRFTAPIPPLDLDAVMLEGPAYLIDIDPSSPERGNRRPVVAKTLTADRYIPSDLLAVAPRPGIVLRPGTRYAYVLTKDIAPGFSRPSGFTIDPNLAAVLDARGIPQADVLVATEFTVGDETARIYKQSEAIRAAYHPQLTDLTLDGADTYSGFCRINAKITLPQFQVGQPPFNTDGRFVLDANDVPQKQSETTIPVVITLPKARMPDAGWPLYQFFHGSGGLSSGLVDLGYSPVPSDMPEPGKGPGYVVALQGIAAASGAMPINPERVPGAKDYEYLNINNLAAFPHTFTQGVFEQRMLLDALLAVRIPDSVLTGCTGITSPNGEHFFDPMKVVAGGQSMGGMYTNLITAVEPRYGAIVPTGAGGFWNLMILESSLVPGARQLLGTALGINDEELSFVHPAMDLLSLAWEPGEPVAAMARISRYPLPGFSPRNVYEPVAPEDENFPTTVYDAAALAYGNQQAGDPIWSSMQDALGVDGLGGLLNYPVSANEGGKTRVVVQFMGDGIISSHYLYRQLETVKHQYSCFLGSYVRTGVPTVPAPNFLAHPCD